ncbi:hypothetical protein HYX05_02530 [Candidatus Woesearchaeota archaeon]|nr:hypothetical protein [Candidatus Woesearchaeota archaeon]
MFLDWLRKDEFKDFYQRVKRLEKFVKLSDKELLIDQYVELRTHFKKTKKLFHVILKLFSDELIKIKSLPQSQLKERLELLVADLNEKLSELRLLIDNGLELAEEILKIRVIGMVNEQKSKLMRLINYLLSIIDAIEEKAAEIRKIYSLAAQEVANSPSEPVSRLSMVGRMYNLWPLNNIQSVIIELGGKIEKTDGQHPYKIIFKGNRPIPLSKHSPPDAIVREVSRATGRSKKDIEASFAKGKFLAA